MPARRLARRLVVPALLTGVSAIALAATALATPPRIPTTLSDFYFYGHQPVNNTQSGGTFEPLHEASECSLCHVDFTEEAPARFTLPYNRWSTTMMAQAARDPVYHAQMQIAEKDASFSSDACVRCHFPAGWAQNRGPTRPAEGPVPFDYTDANGVACSVCHRMVDPIENVPSPLAGTPGTFTDTTDRDILEALGVDRPPNFANGGPVAANSFILDPEDRRRGPYDLGFNPYHNWLQSEFHEQARLCASCHDISNPAFTKQVDGTYAINTVGAKHPTGNKYDMYPLDRTYSEWLASSFAVAPVELTVPNPNNPGDPPVGRYAFDGVTRTDDDTQYYIFNSNASYAECQSCHQPDTEGVACNLQPPTRDVPVHNFAGGNTWVQKAIFDLYGADSGVVEIQPFLTAIERNREMLRKGADLSASVSGSDLVARVTNQSGHKFPTGFSEGRRVWVNVKFYDANNDLLAEHGAYDSSSATLTENDTKVYQSKHGIDTNVAAYLAQRAIDLSEPSLALPYGPSFHLDVNNKIFFDNRIPPRGFTNAGFEAVQAKPAGYTYADGQYWDDTTFAIPPGARRADVRLFHQTTSRDYAEFLRDNATGVSDFVPQPLPPPPVPLSIGQIVYDQWVKWGRSKPAEIGFATVDIGGACNLADVTEVGGTTEFPGSPDGQLTVDDVILFVNLFSDATGCPGAAPCSRADVCGVGGPPEVAEGELTVDDVIAFFNAFADGC